MAEKPRLPDTPMTEATRRECLAPLSSIPADDGLVETADKTPRTHPATRLRSMLAFTRRWCGSSTQFAIYGAR
jgi:hypothetical protein